MSNRTSAHPEFLSAASRNANAAKLQGLPLRLSAATTQSSSGSDRIGFLVGFLASASQTTRCPGFTTDSLVGLLPTCGRGTPSQSYFPIATSGTFAIKCSRSQGKKITRRQSHRTCVQKKTDPDDR